jgi:hypothetical protein
MRNEQIHEMLEGLGHALSEGDLPAIADAWEAPALVLGDEGAMPVADSEQVKRFFSQAVAWYHEHGMQSTRPEVMRVEFYSPRLAAVDVRWPAFDAQGARTSSELSHYMVHEGRDGKPRIQVAVSMIES